MALSDLEMKWEGYEEQYSSGGITATANYTCVWSDRSSLISSDLLGAQNSDLTYLICSSATVKPLGDANSLLGGPKTAWIEAGFEPQGFVIDQGGAVRNALSDWTEHWEAGGEALAIEEGWKWQTDNKLVKKEDRVSGVKIIPHATLTLSGKTTADISDGKTNMLKLIGKVNSVAYTIKNFSYAAQTLLFLGPDLQETIDEEGNTAYNCTLKFGVKYGHTWNQFWRPDKGEWGNLIDAKNELPPYSDARFSDLDPKNW